MSVHVQVEISCNVCQKANFKGKRYKCLRCFDFDMCSSCYESNDKPKPDDEPHESTHPIQCVIPREEFALYYGGEEVGDETILSFTCPLCALTGFTKQTLKRHAVKHTGAKANPLHVVVCPVCLTNPSEDGILTDDFVTHINIDHNISNDDSDMSEDEESVAAPTNLQVNRVNPSPLNQLRQRVLRMNRNISDSSMDQEQYTYLRNQFLLAELRESTTSQPPRENVRSRLRVLSDYPTISIYSDEPPTRTSGQHTTSGRNSPSTTAVYSDELIARTLGQNTTIVRNSPSTLTVYTNEPTTRTSRQNTTFVRNSPSTITVYSDEPTTRTPRTRTTSRRNSPPTITLYSNNMDLPTAAVSPRTGPTTRTPWLYTTSRRNSPPTITVYSNNMDVATAAVSPRTEPTTRTPSPRTEPTTRTSRLYTTSRRNSPPTITVYSNNMDVTTAAVSPRTERNPRRPATTPSNTIDLDYELAVQMQQSENDRVRRMGGEIRLPRQPRQRSDGLRLSRAREIVANLERLQDDGNRREVGGINHTRREVENRPPRQRSDGNTGSRARAAAELITERLHEDGNRREVGGINHTRREVEIRQRSVSDRINRASEIVAQLQRLQEHESRLEGDNRITQNLRMAALARLQEETRKKLKTIRVNNTGKDAKEPKTEPEAAATTEPPETQEPQPELKLQKVFKKIALKEEQKRKKGRDVFFKQLLLSTIVERESPLVEEVKKVEEEKLKAEKKAEKKSGKE